jgi:mRNA interferase RelE/StbE
MGSYRVEIKRSAGKELQRLRTGDKRRVISRIRALAKDPRPSGAKKLSGEEKYRIRQGNYRILYEVHDNIITVVVVRIAHRREAYHK